MNQIPPSQFQPAHQQPYSPPISLSLHQQQQQQPQMQQQGQYQQMPQMQQTGQYQQPPMQQQGQFNHQTPQQPQQPPHMAYNQPGTAQNYPPGAPILGQDATILECPRCHAKGMTRTEFVTGNCTHISSLFCCTFLCCCLPYVSECFKDVRHICQSCGQTITTWKRSNDKQNLGWAMFCLRCCIAAEGS